MIRLFQHGVSAGGSSFEINATKEVLLAPFDLNKGDVFYKFVEFGLNKITNPDTLPTSFGYGCAFSPDGKYLAVAHQLSPFITIYDMSSGVPVKIANPDTLPTEQGQGCAFSPDGKYLAVAHQLSPFITIYDMSSGVPVKIANPDTLPAGTGYGCSFSPDGRYLAVAHNSPPFITIYDMSSGVPVKIANPATLPTEQGQGCAFSPDGKYLAVAHIFSPKITIYGTQITAYSQLPQLSIDDNSRAMIALSTTLKDNEMSAYAIPMTLGTGSGSDIPELAPMIGYSALAADTLAAVQLSDCKYLINMNVSQDQEFSCVAGYEPDTPHPYHLSLKSTANDVITVTIPDTGRYVNKGTKSSVEMANGEYAEIDVYYDADADKFIIILL